MKKLFYQNYQALQGSIEPADHEQQIEEALTLHPYKDHRYIYSTKQYLHQTNVTRLKKIEKNIKDDIVQMDKMIKDERLSRVVPDREDALRWSFLRDHRYYTFGEIAVKRHCRKFEKHSVYNLCDTLNKWIKEEGRKSNRDAYLKHPNFLFQTLDPIFGQRTIVNARVHPEKGVRVNRQYEMEQRFEELTLDGLEQLDDEIDTNRNDGRVNFVIPLYGRNDPFLRFVENFENVALKTKENVSFLVMFFRDGKNDVQYRETSQIIDNLKFKYGNPNLRIIALSGSFQRAIALQKASHEFSKDALLFLVDIDCSFDQQLLYRIRQNTHQGKQVYFPIMFSQYDPHMMNSSSKPVRDDGSSETFANDNGYWRMSSYGQVALYKSDFDAAGGFNTNIKGWGKEDLDFVQRIIAKKITIFRSTDNGLVHIFHTINCDNHLQDEQYKMCLGTKYATFGSSNALASKVYNTPAIADSTKMPDRT